MYAALVPTFITEMCLSHSNRNRYWLYTCIGIGHVQVRLLVFVLLAIQWYVKMYMCYMRQLQTFSCADSAVYMSTEHMCVSAF